MKTSMLFFVLTAIMLLATANGFCTMTNYAFQSSIGVFNQISGETILGTSANDEESFNEVPIGFNFTFNEQTFNCVSINSNGFIVFGEDAQNSYSAISDGMSNNVIAVFNNDLISWNREYLPGKLSVNTTGNAPSRIFTVQWNHYKRNLGLEAEDLTFQIKLFENTNVIQFHYGDSFAETVADYSGIQVGLRGYNNWDYKNRVTYTDWSSTVNGTTNSAVCVLNETVYPANGLTFTWTPFYQNTVPCIAEAVYPVDNNNNVSAFTTLVWQGTGGCPVSGFKLYFGTNNPPNNIVNGLVVNYALYQPSPVLDINTTYYWKVVPFNTYGDAANCPVWTFSTSGNSAVVALPYLEYLDDAEVGQLPEGWVSFNSNNDDKSWEVSDIPGNTGNVSLICEGNPEIAMNDWLVSPPVILEGQTSYRFRFYVKVSSTTNFEQLELRWGNSPNPVVMAVNPSYASWWLGNQEYEIRDLVILPEYRGTYYFGFHGVTQAASTAIYIDDIKIHQYYGNVFPPLNFAVQPGNCCVTLTWDPPAEGILVGYKVYRNYEEITPDFITETSYMDCNLVNETPYSYFVSATYLDPEGTAATEAISVTPSPTGNNNAQNSGIKVTGIIDTYPNPFNPVTTIKYSVAHAAKVTLDIFNVRGQKVRNLVKDTKQAGQYSVTWNGKDDQGQNLSSGIYFSKMIADGKISIRKMIMLK